MFRDNDMEKVWQDVADPALLIQDFCLTDSFFREKIIKYFEYRKK